MRAGQAVVAVLYQGDLNIGRTEAGGDIQRDLPGDGGVLLAVEEADGAGEGDFGVEEILGGGVFYESF